MTFPGVKYSREVMDRVYSLMAEGLSIKKIGKMPDMPSAQTIQEWVIKYPTEEGDRYARARDLQAEAYAGEIVDIADTEKDPQIARNRIDARKWVASKLAPKRYGDRVEVDHNVNGGLAAVIVNVLPSVPPAPQAIDVTPSPAALPKSGE